MSLCLHITPHLPQHIHRCRSDDPCDPQLQVQIQTLQAQLAQRPPLDRVQALTRELALKLGGAHGGLLGLRNNAAERGRGVNGEGMADPVPDATRVIKIGVGEWYPFAEEVKERFLADAEEGGYARFVEVFGVDEWGRRTDGKQWAGERQRGTKIAELVEKAEGAAEELDVD